MDPIEERVNRVRELTPGPGEGYNVVGVDSFASDPSDELFFVSNHATREEAQRARDAKRAEDPDGRYYVYPASEDDEVEATAD